MPTRPADLERALNVSDDPAVRALILHAQRGLLVHGLLDGLRREVHARNRRAVRNHYGAAWQARR